MTDEAANKLGLHNMSGLEYIRLKWNKIMETMTIAEFFANF